MTPDQIAKCGSEQAHQTAFFAWCAVAFRNGILAANEWNRTSKLIETKGCGEPRLKWIHAIHNQGHGDAIRGARAKMEGVKAGVYDVFLPYPCGQYHGLYIELKKPSIKPVKETSKDGRSDKQVEFANDMQMIGYATILCYGWREMANAAERYLNLGEFKR